MFDARIGRIGWRRVSLQTSARLYESLQKAVDDQMQQTGFVPPDGYGMSGEQRNGTRGSQQNGDAGISEKQLDLVNRIVRENNINKTEVENLAVQMVGGRVRTLNRMQASNLIDDLFEKYPRHNGNGNSRGNFQRGWLPPAPCDESVLRPRLLNPKQGLIRTTTAYRLYFAAQIGGRCQRTQPIERTNGP